MSIGSYLELKNDYDTFNLWVNGDIEVWFRDAADFLHKHPNFSSIETYLNSLLQDDLYSQKTPKYRGGFVRRLHRYLCRYVPGAPGYTNMDMWQSNGPVYCPEIFTKWVRTFSKVYMVGFILSKLTRPDIKAFHSPKLLELIKTALIFVPEIEDGSKILHECKTILFS